MQPNRDRLRRPLVVGLIVSAAVWAICSLFLQISLRPPDPVSPEAYNDIGCADLVAQRLTDVGLQAAISFLPHSTLYVMLPNPIASESDSDRAAQLAWLVFDVTATLPDECPYARLHLDISLDDVHLLIETEARDLHAWGEGSLSDSELVGRVLYTQHPSP